MAQNTRPGTELPALSQSDAALFGKARHYIEHLVLALIQESRNFRQSLVYLEGRAKDLYHLWREGAISATQGEFFKARVYEAGKIKFITATLQTTAGAPGVTVDLLVNAGVRATITIPAGSTSAALDDIVPDSNRIVVKGDILEFVVTAAGAGPTDLLLLVGVA